MTDDFIVRRIGAQTLNTCLGRDEMQPLMSEYALAKRAGSIVGNVLRPFRMNIDFQDPAYCRIHGHTLTILVENAGQQNRVRQLTPRLCAAVAAGGLPITEVEVRIIAKQPLPNLNLALPTTPRQPSAMGAAAITNVLNEIEDPSLKETMARLRDALTPETTTRQQVLEEKLASESLQLVLARQRHTASLGDYDYSIQSLHILSEDEVRDYPRLEAERMRALHRRFELEDKKRIAQRAIERIDEQLERIDQALTLLPVDIQAAEAALVPINHDATPPQQSAPRTSPAAAAAIASIARHSSSPLTRKSLMSHLDDLKPKHQDYVTRLNAGIQREKRRLLNLITLTEAQKKRLTLLLTAEKALEADPTQAESIADQLYGLDFD